MSLTERIQSLIEPTVVDLDFDIVRVQITGQKKPRMQVMVERKDGRGMTVDDCAVVSRAISAVLDVDDPIRGAFTLEVSSPGIDRPLVRLGDFERFKGLDAKLEIHRPIDGRRRFQGRLIGVEGDTVRLLVDGREMALPYPDIHRAKLLLTDELIEAAAEEKEGS